MELTREQAIKEHRDQWQWQAENPMLPKSKYPKFTGVKPLKECYLCQFTHFNCSKCPVEWPKTCEAPYTAKSIPCMNSYFYQWEKATLPEERSRLAALIRDLPEKKTSQFKPGDAVKVMDGSYSYYFGEEGIEHCGNLSQKAFEVLETSVTMPMYYRTDGKKADPMHDDVPDNDIIIKEIATGKKISIQERFLKKVKSIEKPALKVGDWVKVKSLKQLKSEFPVLSNGSIECGRDNFIDDMHDLCGKEFAITEITNGFIAGLNTGYNITPEMLELIPAINLAPCDYTITESKTFTFKGNKTTCIIEIDGRKFKGCTKCSPADEWDEQTGKDWAELRAQRKMLDAVEKELRQG